MQSDRPVERQVLIVDGQRAACVLEVAGSPDNGDDDRMGEVAQPKNALGANIPWLFGIPVILLVPLTAIRAS